MRVFVVFLCVLLLSGCAVGTGFRPAETVPVGNFPSPETAPSETPEVLPQETTASRPLETQPPDPIAQILEAMTIEERVGQLFLIRCDQETVLADIQAYHPGGILFFGADFKDRTPDSFREALTGYQSQSKLPLLLAVDEEGGTVTRISRYSAFRQRPFPDSRTAFAQGGMEAALENQRDICAFLSDLGLNVNMGPVCDISTDPAGFLYQRSLGQDAQTTEEYVAQTVGIMASHRIGSVLKHFPGYGDNADTHTGIALDSRSLEELESWDLQPFAAGIQAGCGAILVSHTIVEAMDGSLPASLSPAVHRYLREDMGFAGVIVTDDLVMEAITGQYGAGDAAVLAVQAGNDLLCSTDYATQYEAVLGAVLDGRIDFDVLNAAVRRVLSWKAELGLL